MTNSACYAFAAAVLLLIGCVMYMVLSQHMMSPLLLGCIFAAFVCVVMVAWAAFSPSRA